MGKRQRARAREGVSSPGYAPATTVPLDQIIKEIWSPEIARQHPEATARYGIDKVWDALARVAVEEARKEHAMLDLWEAHDPACVYPHCCDAHSLQPEAAS